MAARKKTTKRGDRSHHHALDRIERELPPNLRRLVKQVRRGFVDLEKQVERTRREGEVRWKRQQLQMRRDIAALLRRLEKAVDPPKKRKRTTKKKTTPQASSSG